MTPLGFAERVMVVCLKWKASVTSWGRTDKRNSFMGGVKGSCHLLWLGIDVVMDDQKKDVEFEKDCNTLGLVAIYEGDHYHLQPAGV